MKSLYGLILWSWILATPLLGDGQDMFGQNKSSQGCNNKYDRDQCKECKDRASGLLDELGSGGKIDTLSLEYQCDTTDYELGSFPKSCRRIAPGGCSTLNGHHPLPFPSPRLKVQRLFRSRSFWPCGHFGFHTKSNFEYRLALAEGPTWRDLYLYAPNGYDEKFVDDYSGNWTKASGTVSSVVEVFDPNAGVVVRRRDGSRLHFAWFGPVGIDQVGGRLTRIENRNGNALIFAYDQAFSGWERCKPTKITDPFGRSLGIEWVLKEGYHFVSSITLPDGRKIDYLYDGSPFIGPTRILYPDGTLSQSWIGEDGDGVFWAFNDVMGEPKGRKDRLYRHDINGAARGVRTVDGHLRYTGTWWMEPDLSYTNLHYYNGVFLETRTDHNGLVLYQHYPDIDAQRDFVTNPWHNRPDQYTDELGRTTYFEYDGLSNLTKVTYPDGALEKWTFNAYSQVTSYTDPLERITSYTYDGVGNKGNLVRIDYPDGTFERWEEYNAFGRPGKYYDRAGNETVYVYGDCQDLVKEILPDDSPDPGDNPYRQFTYDDCSRLLCRRDADGFVIQFAYDAMDRVTEMTYQDGSHEAWIYGTDDPGDPDDPAGTAGLVVAYVTRHGYRLDYEYDGDDRLTMVHDPQPLPKKGSLFQGAAAVPLKGAPGMDHDYKQYVYDFGTERLAAVSDHGDLTTHEYDAVGRTSKTHVQADASQVMTTAYHYNKKNQVVGLTDPYGFEAEVAYDDRDRMIERRRYLDLAKTHGAVTSRTYNKDGSLQSETDENGNTVFYHYDAYGRLLAALLPATTDDLGNPANPAVERKVYQYDPYGRIGAVDFADGGRQQMEYDPLNRGRAVRLFLDAAHTKSLCTEKPYTPGGNLDGYTLLDEFGNIARRILYTYACCGRRLTERMVMSPSGVPDDAVDLITRYTYDGNGNILTETDPSGAVTRHAYDGWNRRTKTIDPADKPWKTVYYNEGDDQTHPDFGDSRLAKGQGSAVKTVDPLGNERVTVSDGAGRILKEVDELGGITTLEYGLLGDLIEIRSHDPAGRIEITRLDSLGRTAETVEDHGNLERTTRFFHDDAGNRLGILDGEGHGTAYLYNERNEWIRSEYADGGAARRGYDQMGRLRTKTLQSGTEVATLDYDLIGRTSAVTYSTGGGISFVRDASGGILNGIHTLYSTSVDCTYDMSGRVLSETQLLEGDGRTVTYAYDRDSRKTTIVYPGGRTVERTLDARRHLAEVTEDGSTVATYTYDDAGRLLQRSLGTGFITDYAHNARSDLTALRHRKPDQTTLAGWNLGWDAAGNKTYEEDLRDPSLSKIHFYDTLDRLVAYKRGPLNAAKDDVPAPNLEQSWTLSLEGDWVSWSDNGTVENRIHSMTHELLQRDGTVLAYDAKGNLLDDGTYLYTWDINNLLTEVRLASDHSPVAEYRYDYARRCVSQWSASSDTTHRLVWGGEDRWQILEEYEKSGGGPLALSKSFVYGGRIDEPLSFHDEGGGSSFRYHQGQQSGIAAITTPGGAVQEIRDYLPYGESTVVLGSELTGNPFTFTGRRLDRDTGLLSFRNRPYACGQGRFVARDPAAYLGGMNLYNAYFVPDEVDPHGLLILLPPGYEQTMNHCLWYECPWPPWIIHEYQPPSNPCCKCTPKYGEAGVFQGPPWPPSGADDFLWWEQPGMCDPLIKPDEPYEEPYGFYCPNKQSCIIWWEFECKIWVKWEAVPWGHSPTGYIWSWPPAEEDPSKSTTMDCPFPCSPFFHWWVIRTLIVPNPGCYRWCMQKYYPDLLRLIEIAGPFI